jgi:hypothetical protein
VFSVRQKQTFKILYTVHDLRIMPVEGYRPSKPSLRFPSHYCNFSFLNVKFCYFVADTSTGHLNLHLKYD